MHRGSGPEPDRRIKIVFAEPGCPTCWIGNSRLHADPVARLQFRHRRPDLDDLARSLMAEDHRFLDHEWADGTMGIVVHIAAADSDRAECNPDIPRPKLLLDGKSRRLSSSLRSSTSAFISRSPF
jgi:hypothetical protein